jgi:ADP-heptose:LPS heptosyltransferase
MPKVLVIQLARLGDLLQTARLIASLARYGQAGEPAMVHLLTDAGLAEFAARTYPGVAVHGLPAHAGATSPGAVAETCRRALDGLAGHEFAAVYNINFSPLSLALSAFFDPDQVVGHRLTAGQARKDAWAAMLLRAVKNRAASCLNLMDYWAGFAPALAAPETVNPQAAPGGGGLGVAVSGRQARRSPPPRVLAGIVAVLAAKRGYERITLLGTAAEAAGARAVMKNLPPNLLARTRDLTGKTGLAGLGLEVSSLDELLTPDTGLMHLAASRGVPVTALFLSSAWCHETGPYGLGHTVWQSAPDCAPCLEARPCPNEVRCLDVFSGPEFQRLIATAGRAPVPLGLTGYHSGFDALGAVCAPFAGSDPQAGARARLRGLTGRYLAGRLARDPAGKDFSAGPGDPETAGELYLETDYVLPGRGPRPPRGA